MDTCVWHVGGILAFYRMHDGEKRTPNGVLRIGQPGFPAIWSLFVDILDDWTMFILMGLRYDEHVWNALMSKTDETILE